MNEKIYKPVSGESLEEVCWKVYGGYKNLLIILELNKVLAEKNALESEDRVILPSSDTKKNIASIPRVGR